MSKSRGNVVDPVEQLSKFGVDPVRYFLLKEGSLLKDGGMCIVTMMLFKYREYDTSIAAAQLYQEIMQAFLS